MTDVGHVPLGILGSMVLAESFLASTSAALATKFNGVGAFSLALIKSWFGASSEVACDLRRCCLQLHLLILKVSNCLLVTLFDCLLLQIRESHRWIFALRDGFNRLIWYEVDKLDLTCINDSVISNVMPCPLLMFMFWFFLDLAQTSTNFLRLRLMGSWPLGADYLLGSLISLEVGLVIIF